MTTRRAVAARGPQSREGRGTHRQAELNQKGGGLRTGEEVIRLLETQGANLIPPDQGAASRGRHSRDATTLRPAVKAR